MLGNFFFIASSVKSTAKCEFKNKNYLIGIDIVGIPQKDAGALIVLTGLDRESSTRGL